LLSKLSKERMNKSLEKRFWPKVNKTDTCWLWTASKTGAGYGQISNKPGPPLYAHRVSYEFIKGPIPEDCDLDHLCRNHACVNPDHLEAVTHKENVMRGIGASAKNYIKTHCKYGHEFTSENTKIKTNGSRCCRICDRRLKRQWKKNKKARGISRTG